MANTDLSYNLDYLREISNNDEDFLIDMINTFIESAPETLDEMQKQMEDSKWEMVAKTAHKFSSSVKFIGVQNIIDDLADIENLALQRKETGKIQSSMDSIRKNIMSVIESLKKDFNLN